jgi:hypothetical protein
VTPDLPEEYRFPIMAHRFDRGDGRGRHPRAWFDCQDALDHRRSPEATARATELQLREETTMTENLKSVAVSAFGAGNSARSLPDRGRHAFGSDACLRILRGGFRDPTENGVIAAASGASASWSDADGEFRPIADIDRTSSRVVEVVHASAPACTD